MLRRRNNGCIPDAGNVPHSGSAADHSTSVFADIANQGRTPVAQHGHEAIPRRPQIVL